MEINKLDEKIFVLDKNRLIDIDKLKAWIAENQKIVDDCEKIQ